MKTTSSLLILFFLTLNSYAQDTIIYKRSDIGAILSVQGHRPLAMNSLNKDYNLTQTNGGIESALFYRTYLGEMFDLQIEALTGGRNLDILDTLSNFRLTDVYYALNALAVLKSREDTGPHKVTFGIALGPSINFLGTRKFAYPQTTVSYHSNLGFADVITLAACLDIGIKYNYTLDSSFLLGFRITTDHFILNQNKDPLQIKYNNFGLYAGFAGKIRKR